MIIVPQTIRQFFLDAGWVPGRRAHATEASNISHAALSVFTEFGGLKVGACGAGLDCAASDVRFLTHPHELNCFLVAPWNEKLGSLTAVAQAHNDHIVVFLNGEGIYYFFTDPD
ncbi:MAG TPA: SUKH-3 domain-containing protein, partial [Verrucomicrobiae bacterium]|nr:SUKH-3 domain-containing protein [Verrucomicrobiae bacterium]